METVRKIEQRSLAPDVCRGIAIFLVIWGHVLQQGLNGVTDVAENVVFKIIYSFHMPLFMMISGFFFYKAQERKNLKELVLDKVWLLLRVILIWNTVCYFLKILLSFLQGNKGSVSVKGWFDEILLGYWFLWAVLFFTIAVGLVCKFFPRKIWLLGCLLFALIMLISPCRWVMLSIYPFYLIGFFYNARIKEGKSSFVELKYVAICLFVVGLVFYLSHSAVGNSEIKGLLDVCICILRKETGADALLVQGLRVSLYYFLGLAGSITVIVLAELMVKKVSDAGVIRWIAEVGKYSLQIYILQRVIVELLLGKAYSRMVESVKDMPMLTNVFFFVISVICTVVIFIVAKYGFRGKIKNVLFGR